VKNRQPSRSNDPRAQRSREALRRSLLELIAIQPFDQISIRQITKTARVSYPTFFSNFESKEALFADIATDEIRELTALMIRHLDPRNTAVSANAACRYVDDRRPLWTTLLTSGAASLMREEFLGEACEFVRKHGLINPGVPGELTAAVAFSGMFEVLAWWLRQPEDYPANRIAKYLELLVLNPTTSGHAPTFD
jgi:AcrR family transcriptional regulator